MDVEELVRKAEERDAEGIERILGSDPFLVNGRDERGWSALQRAAQFGRTEIVKYLLVAGADVASLDHRRFTPLHAPMSAAHCLLIRPQVKGRGGRGDIKLISY